MTIFLLISCKNSEKKETENNSEPEKKLTQSEFKKIESPNALAMEYQLLDENDDLISFSSLKTLPEFPGGFDSLTVFVQRNFEFPQGDFEEIEGKVKSSFVIDTFGKVVDIKIIERLRWDYDTLCYGVIAKIPDWQPAELNSGKKVKTKFILPFKFELEK